MSTKNVSLSFTHLLRAQKSFEKFRTRLTDEQLKAGAIKAFEYCFELSWKTLKKYLEIYETEEDIKGSRDTVRVATRLGIIKNPDLWFDFIEGRNATSHVYEESTADDIIDLFPLFSDELEHVINEMQRRIVSRA
jgi:nucleotidyltransferase substrate binding protein (TIGR01987 family)